MDGTFIANAINLNLTIFDRICALLMTNEVRLIVPCAVVEEIKEIGADIASSLNYVTDSGECEIFSDLFTEGMSARSHILKTAQKCIVSLYLMI